MIHLASDIQMPSKRELAKLDIALAKAASSLSGLMPNPSPRFLVDPGSRE